MLSGEYVRKLNKKFEQVQELATKKARQYKTHEAFAAFETAARLKYGDARYNYQYAALKDFMSKHVAHIYNNDLDGDKISESLTDIAVLGVLGVLLRRELVSGSDVDELLAEIKRDSEVQEELQKCRDDLKKAQETTEKLLSYMKAMGD